MQKFLKFQEIFNGTINIYISFLIHLIKTFFNLQQSLNVIIVIYKIHLIISTRVTIHVQKYRGERLRETLLVLLLRAASSTVNYKSQDFCPSVPRPQDYSNDLVSMFKIYPSQVFTESKESSPVDRRANRVPKLRVFLQIRL